MMNPTVAYLMPTGRCNLHCEGCYATLEHAGRTSAKLELSFAEYRSVIDELVTMGVRTFDISGGEPLMYGRIAELCEYIRQHDGTEIMLVTNGTRERLGVLQRLSKVVNRLVISLDAPEPALHDHMRGMAGAFQLSLRTLRRARALRFQEVAINQLLCVSNYASVGAMLRLCSDEHVDRLSLLMFRDVSENAVMPQMVPPLKIQQQTWSEVARLLGAVSHPRIVNLVVPAFLRPEAKSFHASLPLAIRRRVMLLHPNLRGASAFRSAIVIKPFGTVTGDTAMWNDELFEIGNAREGLRDIWVRGSTSWRERIAARERDLSSAGPCQGCARWHVCRGGCVAAATHQAGRSASHDKTCDAFRAAGAF